MSSFLKKGKREDLHKKVNKHKKEVFKMLHNLRELATLINIKNPDIDFNNKKIVKKAAEEITERELDNLEVIILINNIRNLRIDETTRKAKNNNKEY